MSLGVYESQNVLQALTVCSFLAGPRVENRMCMTNTQNGALRCDLQEEPWSQDLENSEYQTASKYLVHTCTIGKLYSSRQGLICGYEHATSTFRIQLAGSRRYAYCFRPLVSMPKLLMDPSFTIDNITGAAERLVGCRVSSEEQACIILLIGDSLLQTGRCYGLT